MDCHNFEKQKIDWRVIRSICVDDNWRTYHSCHFTKSLCSIQKPFQFILKHFLYSSWYGTQRMCYDTVFHKVFLDGELQMWFKLNILYESGEKVYHHMYVFWRFLIIILNSYTKRKTSTIWRLHHFTCLHSDLIIIIWFPYFIFTLEILSKSRVYTYMLQ